MSAVSAQQDGADQPPEAALATPSSANDSSLERQLDVLTVQAVLAQTQGESVPQPESESKSEKSNPASQFANLHDILSLFIRAISISVLTSALFFGLAILATANRVGTKSLQIHDLSFSFASLVTKVSVPAFLAMALMNEVLLLVFREAHGERQAVDRAKILLPILSMIECGLFGWLLFSQDDRGPKETMLIAGASLAGFLGGALQVLLFETMAGLKDDDRCPTTWVAMIVLLGATFLGGINGWTGYSPQFVELIRYREKLLQESPKPMHPSPDDPVKPVM